MNIQYFPNAPRIYLCKHIIQRKKETVYCKNVNNSWNMQRMSMKIDKYGVPDTYI